MEKNENKLKADLTEMEEEWVWGDEAEYTLEQIEGMVAMLEYLILHSHYSNLEDMDNNRQGWAKEELEEELNKLTKKENE
jgi:hypothetical protein